MMDQQVLKEFKRLELNTTLLGRYHSLSRKSTPVNYVSQTVVTDESFGILTVNDHFCIAIGLLEDDLIGKNLIELFDCHLLMLLDVDLEGVLLELRQVNGVKYPVHVWRLKQSHSHSYIWRFETISSSVLYFSVQDGCIRDVSGQLDAFGSKHELEGSHLVKWIPRWVDGESNSYGASSKSGNSFPVTITINTALKELEISSMPHISGIICTTPSGQIEFIGDAFARHLFGRTSTSLVSSNISTLLNLDEFTDSSIPCTPPVELYAIHRDTSTFPVSCTSRVQNGLHFISICYSLKKPETLLSPLLPSPIKESFTLPLPVSCIPKREEWSIDDFQIIQDLGEGAYGFVKLAHRISDPLKRIVIKFILKNKVLAWTRRPDLGRIPVEVAILFDLSRNPHPNIVQMTGFFEDDFFVYFVMPYHADTTDLFDYIEKWDFMPEDQVRRIFYQVCLAIHHLHTLKIAHRDIKDENVIVDEHLNVLLIDFGSSSLVEPSKAFSTFIGTMHFCAPEILEGHAYDGLPQDIWSLGILLYTLTYRENPFYTSLEILNGSELGLPFILSNDALDLMQSLLTRDIAKRPSSATVLKHSWFDSLK